MGGEGSVWLDQKPLQGRRRRLKSSSPVQSWCLQSTDGMAWQKIEGSHASVRNGTAVSESLACSDDRGISRASTVKLLSLMSGVRSEQGRKKYQGQVGVLYHTASL